jgi:lipid-A-disaccharide synthase
MSEQPMSARKILFIAGDTSGDIHCALLARELQSRHTDWKLFALGGPHLRDAGCHLVGDTAGMGVIGFASALAVVPRALRLRRQAVAWARREKPDAVVLCDWGAFNARLLPDLRALDARTLYYFPPRSWQKGSVRALGIATACDRIATPFEWSAQALNEAGGRATWVGHPLLEIVRAAPERGEARDALGVGHGQVLVALLPGSRNLELQLIGPAMGGAAQLVEQKLGSNVCFRAVVPRGMEERAQKYLSGVPVAAGDAAALLKACDAAIVKSGTATLEAAVAGAPQVVCYDVPPLVRAQWKATLQKKVRFVAMPNILLDRETVPELLGDNCRPEPLAHALLGLLENPTAMETMRAGYGEVRRALGQDLARGATERTADLVEELVEG